MRLPPVIFASVAALVVACDEDPKAPAPAASASASAGAAVPATDPVCRPADPSATFTVGPPEAELGASEDEPVALPGAVEVGDALAMPFGFAVTVLGEATGETHAQLALVSARADAGRVVDLGRVHGVVPPPRVARVGAAALVAVADGDVSGTLVRLARVEGDLSGARVAWAATVPQGNDESPVFGLAATGDAASLVWDDWDETRGHGVVRSQTLTAEGAVAREPANVLSDPTEDAEGPRVVGRPGGFWVAWIVNAPLADGERKEVDEGVAPGVALSPRWIRIARLDARGRREGVAITVSPESGWVLGFDVLAVVGGALVVWRDDRTSPATPGGRVLWARVGEDGAVTTGVIASEDVGAGDPVLLDRTDPGASAWLAFVSESDEVRLARVAVDGAVAAPTAEAAFPRGSPLLATRDGLLAAVPLGRSVELSLLRCSAAPR